METEVRNATAVRLVVIVVLALGSVTFADVLVTKGGSRYEGTVVEEGEDYVLTTPSGGKMKVPKSMVVKVIKKKSPPRPVRPHPKPRPKPGPKPRTRPAPVGGSPDVITRGKQATALVDLEHVGTGTAFCIDAGGLFITNRHVVASPGVGGTVKLVLNPARSDQRIIQAEVVATDRERDLAVLHAGGVKGLVALALGDDRTLKETMTVTAFGYPFGKMLATEARSYPSISVNTGRITSLRHKGGKLAVIQIDASVNPGNSGGPVINPDGMVIGVVVSGVRGSGVNFTIPVSRLRDFLKPVRASLDARLAREARITALQARLAKNAADTVARKELILLTIVYRDSPAEAAKLLIDDLDQATRTNVASAAKDLDTLDEAVCLTLGTWYTSLVSKAVGRAKVRMLIRARGCYRRFLDLHAKQDAAGQKVTAALRTTLEDLRKLGVWSLPEGAVLLMTFEPDTIYGEGGAIHVRDLSGSQNHGTLGGARPVRGKAGWGLALDGGAHVLLPTVRRSIVKSKALTLCAWACRKSPGASVRFVFDVGFYGGTSFTVHGNGRFNFVGKEFGPKLDSQITAGKWYHIAAVWDGSSQHYYVDGVRKWSQKRGSWPHLGRIDGRCQARIGCQSKRVGTAGQFFQGYLDEVALFSRALSAEEIKSLYEMGMRGKAMSLPQTSASPPADTRKP